PSFRNRGGGKYPIGEQFRESVERNLYRNNVVALPAEDEGILILPGIADTHGIWFHPEIIRFRILLAERAEAYIILREIECNVDIPAALDLELHQKKIPGSPKRHLPPNIGRA